MLYFLLLPSCPLPGQVRKAKAQITIDCPFLRFPKAGPGQRLGRLPQSVPVIGTRGPQCLSDHLVICFLQPQSVLISEPFIQTSNDTGSDSAKGFVQVRKEFENIGISPQRY